MAGSHSRIRDEVDIANEILLVFETSFSSHSAEHGCYIKYPKEDSWRNLTEEMDLSWMSKVSEIFSYYTERTQGRYFFIHASEYSLYLQVHLLNTSAARSHGIIA